MSVKDVITQATDSVAPDAPAEVSDRAEAAAPVAEVAAGEFSDALDAVPAGPESHDGDSSSDDGAAAFGPAPVPSEINAPSADAEEFDETGTPGDPAADVDPSSDDSSIDGDTATEISDEAISFDDDLPEFDEPGSEAPFDKLRTAPAPDDADYSSEDVRRQLVKQFEAWLDRMAEGEPPPEGLPDELLADALETPEPRDPVGADLYAVFAGLTKLSGEIGLQGRAFRQMTDALAPSAQVPARLERLEAAQNAVARELSRRLEAEESNKPELPAAQELLGVVFDLYDRLNRGLQNFDASYDAARSRAGSGGLLQRLRGGKAQAEWFAATATAMREGYRLTLSRLEAAFLQWGVQRTGAVGDPFDPLRMEVIEVGTAPGVADGSVMEVYRSGYVLNGRVLATARVKVAKAGPSR